MLLQPEARARIEAALRWYRDAIGEAHDLALQLAALYAPTTAKWSHMNAQRGSPGNPTMNRAILAAALQDRYAAARHVVDAVDGWLWAEERHEDDRAMLSLVYGLHTPECVALVDAAASLSIPCETEDEAEAVEAHVDGLLAQIGVALGIVGRGAA